MKFSEIKTSIPKENQAIAQAKFSQLLAELGLRKNNEFCWVWLGRKQFPAIGFDVFVSYFGAWYWNLCQA